MTHRDYLINTPEQLAAIFAPVGDASRKKEVSYIHPLYQEFIEASPFAVLATSGPDGLDASPRGDPPGFIRVVDQHTLLLPERRGNNRADSLYNIVSDPRIALFFLVPGHGETLRVNGKASISIQPDLLDSFAVDGRPPMCVIVIKVESVFFQCARAIQRSKLWDTSTQENKPPLPTAGTILSALTDAAIDGQKYDQELGARQQATLY